MAFLAETWYVCNADSMLRTPFIDIVTLVELLLIGSRFRLINCQRKIFIKEIKFKLDNDLATNKQSNLDWKVLNTSDIWL